MRNHLRARGRTRDGIVASFIACLVSTLVACGPTVTVPEAALPLPTAHGASLASGEIQGCSEVLRVARVAGDPRDPRLAWLTDFTTGARIDVTWPPGFRARFGVTMEIIDERGAVVTRTDDVVLGGCGVGDPAGPLMQPPLPGYQLACGPMSVDACATRVTSVARDAGWPVRPIARIAFDTVDGHYVLRYRDGGEISGVARPG